MRMSMMKQNWKRFLLLLSGVVVNTLLVLINKLLYSRPSYYLNG